MQKPSRHTSYFSALQLIADQSQRLIASLMPHHGERGRIAEEIIKGVLLRTLPKRFSVGTGVIVSAAGDVSAQTDIIIYDNIHNSPLLSEFGPGVYPVEIVYATVEVKSVLTKAELRKSIDAIQRIRTVAPALAEAKSRALAREAEAAAQARLRSFELLHQACVMSSICGSPPGRNAIAPPRVAPRCSRNAWRRRSLHSLIGACGASARAGLASGLRRRSNGFTPGIPHCRMRETNFRLPR